MGLAVILVIWPGSFEQTFVPLSHWRSIWNSALIGPAVSEKMFEECGRRRHKMWKPEGQWSCTLSPDTLSCFYICIQPQGRSRQPLGDKCWCHRKPLSLCPFVASFKTISLKYDFKHILNDFIHVYSHRAGTDNPLGTKGQGSRRVKIGPAAGIDDFFICCRINFLMKKNVIFICFALKLCDIEADK